MEKLNLCSPLRLQRDSIFPACHCEAATTNTRRRRRYTVNIIFTPPQCNIVTSQHVVSAHERVASRRVSKRTRSCKSAQWLPARRKSAIAPAAFHSGPNHRRTIPDVPPGRNALGRCEAPAPRAKVEHRVGRSALVRFGSVRFSSLSVRSCRVSASLKQQQKRFSRSFPKRASPKP